MERSCVADSAWWDRRRSVPPGTNHLHTFFLGSVSDMAGGVALLPTGPPPVRSWPRYSSRAPVRFRQSMSQRRVRNAEWPGIRDAAAAGGPTPCRPTRSGRHPGRGPAPRRGRQTPTPAEDPPRGAGDPPFRGPPSRVRAGARVRKDPPPARGAVGAAGRPRRPSLPRAALGGPSSASGRGLARARRRAYARGALASRPDGGRAAGRGPGRGSRRRWG
jgi:hypothetical protein